MSQLTLSPETCLGPASSPPHFTDTETTVRVAGQRLVFAPCSCLHAKQGSHFQTGGTPYGIALVAVCPKAKLVAFAEREVDATVHVWGIGSMSRLASLTAAGKHLEVLALAFCRDGSRVAAVGGAPGLELSVWQWSTRKLLVTLPLAVPCADLSFDPRSASSLCALAGAKLQVCAVKQTYEHFTASATELSPADEVGTGGVWACHAWGAASELYAGTDTGAVTCSSTDAGGMSQRLVLASGSAVAGLVADARLLLVASRDGVLTWYSVATAEALYEVRVEGAIASVAVSPDYLKILATTASGDAHLVTMLTAELPETALEPEEVGAFLAVEKAASFHAGAVATAALLPSVEERGIVSEEAEFVSVGDDGVIRCTGCRSLALLATAVPATDATASTAAATATSRLVAVGFSDGVLRVYQRDRAALKLVHRSRLSTKPLTALAWSPTAEVLAAADGGATLLFIARTPQTVAVIGATDLPTPAASLAWLASVGASEAPKLLAACAGGAVVRMTPPAPSAVPPADLKLQKRSLARGLIKLEAPAVAIAALPEAYPVQARPGASSFLALCDDLALKVYTMPSETASEQQAASLPPSHADQSYPVHEMTPTSLALSRDGSLLATGGADGEVSVRSTANMGDVATISLHDVLAGGVCALALLADADAAPGTATVFSCGCDGAVYASTYSGAFDAPTPPLPPSMTVVYPEVEDVPRAVEAAATGSAAASGGEPSVLQVPPQAGSGGEGEISAHSAQRELMKQQVEGVRAKLLAKIEANAALPVDELEKMAAADFIVDVAQQTSWREEGEGRVEGLRRATERDDLAKWLIASRMKAEFWEAMATPSTVMTALRLPGDEPPGTLKSSVSNFTVPAPKAAELAALRRVKLLRQVEVRVGKWERAQTGADADVAAGLFEEAKEFASDICFVSSGKKSAVGGGSDGDLSPSKARGGDGEAQEPEEAELLKTGAAVGDESFLLLAPFELHGTWRKATQAALCAELIETTKSRFNRKFDELLAAKKAELERIGEKMGRVGEILSELQRLGADVRAEQAEQEATRAALVLAVSEQPEKVLTVNDSEVKAAKLLSAAERAEAERKAKEAEARAAAAAGDNMAERALLDMMNGTLESKRDDEEVMQDLVRPEWMVVTPVDQMTEAEHALVKEFDAKVKKLEAEREKRTKALQTELAKVRLDMADACRFFNERLTELADTKVQYDQAVFETELVTVKLAQARLRVEEHDARVAALSDELKTLGKQKEASSGRLATFRREVEAVRETHEGLASENRSLEKAFKQDFVDAPEHLEVLQKLYRRRKTRVIAKGRVSDNASHRGSDTGGRPSDENRGSRPGLGGRKASKMGAAAFLGAAQQRGSDRSQESYGRRSSSKPAHLLAQGIPTPAAEPDATADAPARPTRDPFTDLDAPATEVVIEPLDAAVDMPEGLSFDMWDRLVEARNAKITAETDLKACGATLAEMNALLQEMADTDDALKKRMAGAAAELAAIRDREARERWNLELPYKLKQGQLEVEEAAVVTDYSEALFVHKGVIAELNAQIRALGGEKVGVLEEIKEFRKEIALLQWENERADREAEDLVELTRELQLLRVTKDLQERINGGGEDNQQAEAVRLERKLEQIKINHEEKVDEYKRQVGKIHKLVHDKDTEMGSLKAQIEQLEASVLEREAIHSIQTATNDDSADATQRFADVHMKRKLQTLVGMQTQEIELLRDELDRLRRRTFPTFTHLEARRAGPRDN